MSGLTPENQAKRQAALRAYINKLVDEAPPLADEQRERLAVLLRPKRLDDVPSSALTPEATRRLLPLLAPGPLKASEINSDPLDVRL